MVYINRNKFLEETIEKYSNMVYRLAMARTRNIETSEDIYQEVFLRLARKMPEFENEEHKKWLEKIANGQMPYGYSIELPKKED